MGHINQGAARKWLKQLTVGSGIVLSLLLAVSVVVRHVAVDRAKSEFPPPGRLVTFGDRASHIHCLGTGSPIILLESGLDDRGSFSWTDVHEDLAEVSRVCAYDRAGMVWSEARDGPRHAERIAAELHALLAAADEPPPYVMVGHSLGGILVRVFDDRYPGEAMGFVLVDSSHPDQRRRAPPEVRARMSDDPAMPRWLMRVLAPYRIFLGERPTPETAYWWRSFPEGFLAEFEAVPATLEQGARTGSLGDRPLVVLVSDGVQRANPSLSAATNASVRRIREELRLELAALSTNSDYRVVEGAGHAIHRDQPDAVVTAVRDVVTAVGASGPIRPEPSEPDR